MLTNIMIIYLFLLCVIVGVVLIILGLILSNPFHYPYFKYYFDISGRRNVSVETEIDNYLIEYGFQEIQSHQQRLLKWKTRAMRKADKSILHKLRNKQLLRVIDDEHAYQFIYTRKQTRYRQWNYQKTAYQVDNVSNVSSYNYGWLENRYEQLKAINFETNLQNYHSKNQRKLMTKELRRQIMERDDYTCQQCGKYMPDEVGLHIDHIIPVSKGGKTVASNLQVLCSKCNGAKSNRI